MKMELKTKFNIGDKVRCYEEKWVSDEKVVCPICKGDYEAMNPNYGFNDDEEVLYCDCCDHGYIYVNKRKEKVLGEEIYVIDRISVSVSAEEISYYYHITSHPYLNGGKPGYISCTAIENDLVLVEKGE